MGRVTKPCLRVRPVLCRRSRVWRVGRRRKQRAEQSERRGWRWNGQMGRRVRDGGVRRERYNQLVSSCRANGPQRSPLDPSCRFQLRQDADILRIVLDPMVRKGERSQRKPRNVSRTRTFHQNPCLRARNRGRDPPAPARSERPRAELYSRLVW